MKFRYTALNQENSQMNGVLEAESIDQAKEELHKMDLSILVINKISEEEFSKEKNKEEMEKERSGIQTYQFIAKDPNQKEINGTIDAKDPYTAFKRLSFNYRFQVLLLYPQGAEELGMDQLKADFSRNRPLWEAQMKEEGVDLGAMREKELKSKALSEESFTIDQQIVEEVDQFIASIKSTLATQSHQFSPPFMAEIQNALNKLDRIRTSNNVNYITQVCNEIYDLVSHPDKLEKIQAREEGELDSNKNLGGAESDMENHALEIESKAAGLERIKGRFGKIISKINPNLSESEEKNDVVTTGFSSFSKKAFAYLRTSNSILRQKRKEEMKRAFHQWADPLKERHFKKKEKGELEPKEKNEPLRWLVELDSFFGWLLCFYVSYFFLAELSLEKRIGLPQAFVLQTLKSPLILNIAIFLVFIHLALKIRNELFRNHFWGSFFILSLSLVGYTLVVTNF